METYHMTESFSTLRINADRMLASFIQLASIGATGDGGVSRVTFSEAHLAARKWFRTEIENAGLEFHMDGAGNYSAVVIARAIARHLHRTAFPGTACTVF
jgi:hypothetical protein